MGVLSMQPHHHGKRDWRSALWRLSCDISALRARLPAWLFRMRLGLAAGYGRFAAACRRVKRGRRV